MALILAIESATKICSIALFQGMELVSYKEEKGDYSHAENLAEFAVQLLKENNFTSRDLAAVAVSKGPGSYTGLRIGVSFAKGLCYALKIPLIAIDTLESLAFAIKDKIEPNALICSMIDARRMEVYTALYNADLGRVESVVAKIIDESSFANILDKHPVYFVGDGAAKCKSMILHSNANFYDKVLCSSIYLGELALDKFNDEDFEDVAYFEPYYHKEFIALKGKKLV